MLGSHDTVAMRPPSKAVRHRDGGCEEVILKPRVGVDAAEVAVRCHYLMGKRGMRDETAQCGPCMDRWAKAAVRSGVGVRVVAKPGFEG
jgi:hypothetical protein